MIHHSYIIICRIIINFLWNYCTLNVETSADDKEDLKTIVEVNGEAVDETLQRRL